MYPVLSSSFSPSLSPLSPLLTPPLFSTFLFYHLSNDSPRFSCSPLPFFAPLLSWFPSFHVLFSAPFISHFFYVLHFLLSLYATFYLSLPILFWSWWPFFFFFLLICVCLSLTHKYYSFFVLCIAPFLVSVCQLWYGIFFFFLKWDWIKRRMQPLCHMLTFCVKTSLLFRGNTT